MRNSQHMLGIFISHILWGMWNMLPFAKLTIAIENGPFIVDSPIKDVKFPVRNVTDFQRVCFNILRNHHPKTIHEASQGITSLWMG